MAAVLIVDLVVIGRRPHEPSMRGGTAIGIFSGLAVLFGLGVWWFAGARFARRVLRRLADRVQPQHRQPVHLRHHHGQPAGARAVAAVRAMVGIVLALVFRGIFIALGAAAIERLSWVFFLFGAFLIWTAAKLYIDYRQHDEEEEATENAVMRWVKRTLPSTPISTAPS